MTKQLRLTALLALLLVPAAASGQTGSVEIGFAGVT